MLNNLNNAIKPIIIFTGPSGVGKGTIEKDLFKFKELRLRLSCSATTRKARVGEINGIHYFFITKKEFEENIKNHKLLEYSFHFDNYYGTLYEEIDRIHKNNEIPFLEIETNGARQILENKEVNKKYKVLTFFIMPPKIEELRNRILNRNTEDSESIKKRLAKAENEIAERNVFDYQIVNDDVSRAAIEIKDIIKKEFNL